MSPAHSIAPGSGQRPGATLVSIIVNCLNGEAYIAAALDSALAQSFEDWELIFYDDQSTDGSAEIFHSYTDPRFRYILAKQPLELTPARDEAIRHSCGEWVAFLDQDDLWMPALEFPTTHRLLYANRRKSSGAIFVKKWMFEA